MPLSVFWLHSLVPCTPSPPPPHTQTQSSNPATRTPAVRGRCVLSAQLAPVLSSAPPTPVYQVCR